MNQMDDKLVRRLGAISLDQLRVFIQVAEDGSFSAAARSLRRAQSAVSYAISNLERLLDVRLFERASHVPALTDVGRSLLIDARNVARDVEQLQARARSMSEGTEPRLALAVSVMLPMPELVAAIGEFREQFPAVSLVLHTEALGGVAQMVLDGTCQIGISEPIPRSAIELARWPLGSVPMVHVVSAAHPLARHRGPIPTSMLHEHVQLVLSDRSRLTEGVDHFVLGGRTWRLADLGAKRAFLKAGFGWGGMPLHLVKDDLVRRRLVRIRPAEWADTPFRVPLFAVFRNAAAPGPAGRWLLERLGARSALPES